jgi:hypothetical protein
MSLFIDIKSEYENNVSEQKKISTEDLINFIKLNILSSKTSKNEDTEYDIKLNDKTQNLLESDSLEDIIPLQLNMTKDINNLPQYIDGILNKFYKNVSRIGVLKYNEEKTLISLYTSILTCIKDDFRILNLNLQQNYVKQLNFNLVSFVNNKFNDFKYKNFKWNKIDMIDKIKKYIVQKTTLKILSDYLHLNIFIVDIKNDKILIVDTFSTFKKCVILFLINGLNFEPIMYKESFCFDPTTDIIQYFIKIKDDIETLISSTDDDDLDKYITADREIKLTLREKNILNLLKKNNPVNLIDPDKITNDPVDLIEVDKIIIDPLILSDINSEKDINNIDECSIDNEVGIDNDLPVIDDISYDENNKNDKKEKKIEIENINEINEILSTKQYNEKTIKLAELQEDAKKLGVSLSHNGKKKTKAQLITDITLILTKK